MAADDQVQFHSVLGPLMERFVEEKRACGFLYRSSAQLLASFDGFLSHEAVSTDELPWAITQ
jgi:hypothetical protein